MDRITEERLYVLEILYRMHDEVGAYPDLFSSDAQERIDQAIALLESPGEKTNAA
jgi:hypothetical protein